MGWREVWRRPSFRWQLVTAGFVLAILAVTIGSFFAKVQARGGTIWNDPLLSMFKPVDVSNWIFAILYPSLGGALRLLVREPLVLLKFCQSYVLLIVGRMLAMWMVPLEPDPDMIVLIDPIVDRFFYTDRIITKDLFFSGHVSILSLMTCAVPSRPVKKVLGVSTLVVGGLLLWQHVHYTADVLVAPLVAWISWRAVNGMHERLQDLSE